MNAVLEIEVNSFLKLVENFASYFLFPLWRALFL